MDSVRRLLTTLGVLAAIAAPVLALDDHNDEETNGGEEGISTSDLGALAFRSVGPALMSGRIGDFAVNPRNKAEYYVAVSSGNVWKTTNNGITFEPIFDDQGSYSIGCITLDPGDPNVVWVGTGENNSQRSVSFGDGVYKSVDAGKSWTNVGLPESEHIGMIAIDPRDTDVVYVASQGPLWNDGGDRGLYKTTDGGETWDRILHISEKTGFNEIHLDPRDPGVMYASAYQRRRHVWTLINGGPESGLWKSTEAGKTWKEINAGLPAGDKGRIGLDISPVNPDLVYAIVEAGEESGFFRSTDRGETWQRMSDHLSTSPQYYQELVCHPTDVDTVYALDTFTHVTEDGGATWDVVPRENRHVDDHALWIDPDAPHHMIMGGDGGIYDSYDGGKNWRFMANLPVTQFYRVSVDNAEPFYNIYGGTQDNNTQGGPSRTNRREGITNADWFITVGGDGYETVVDPTNPNILYSQWQYGGLVRFDRRSGELLDIRPMEEPGAEPYVFNWDTPLILSPHSHKRLYFAGNYLLRSDDRGENWETVSPNLTRDLDRNQLEVMGVIQPPEAIAKHDSTSIYGNSVALDESPIEPGLLYLGTDDGVINISEDGGETWRRVLSEDVPGVPELTYVASLTASVHEADVVFASFENKKMGDFTPYLYRSDDRGRTWESIAGDLPDRHICYTLREDHENPDLLFLATEFACMASMNGGENWIKLPGIPTISVRDIEIQRRENDVVAGTFGRSFYVLDDYTPLRTLTEEMMQDEATLFPVKDADRYAETSRLGGSDGRGFQGASFYNASNPPFGATFTYLLGEKFQTLEERRIEEQQEAQEEGESWDYPDVDRFRLEARERTPAVYLEITNDAGEVVRRVKGSREEGLHRTTWDLSLPSTGPIEVAGGPTVEDFEWETGGGERLAPEGEYTVTLMLEDDGEVRTLAGPESFMVKNIEYADYGEPETDASRAFAERAAELRRAVQGALRVAEDTAQRLRSIQQAAAQTPEAGPASLDEVDDLRLRLRDLLIDLRGDPVLAQQDMAQAPSIAERANYAGAYNWYGNNTEPPTSEQREQYGYAAAAFEDALADLRVLIEDDLPELEAELEAAGAPWTPGRLPDWEPPQ